MVNSVTISVDVISDVDTAAEDMLLLLFISGATDLEIGVEVTVELNVIGEGVHVTEELGLAGAAELELTVDETPGEPELDVIEALKLDGAEELEPQVLDDTDELELHVLEGEEEIDPQLLDGIEELEPQVLELHVLDGMEELELQEDCTEELELQ